MTKVSFVFPHSSFVVLNPRRLITLIASFVITAIFLWLALSAVDLSKLAHAFASADYRLVGVAALFTFSSYALRTARWTRFLAPTKKIPIPRLFPVLVIGFALNNLLPGRPGEFARAYLLGRRENLSKTLGLATIIVERVADGIALIALLLLALLAFTPLEIDLPQVAETIAALATVVFGVALAGLVFLLLREKLALSILQRLTRFLPHALAVRIERMLGSFVVGLHSLKSPTDVVVIAVLSLLIWSVESAAYFTMLNAFGVALSLSGQLVASVFMMVLINLGIMIPAAPGGLGPYEAAAVFALGAFGVTGTMAASVALAEHAVQFILITGLGLIFIWREGISLAQVSAKENVAAE